MNYIKELNAFYQQIIFNPLSGSAVSLWNTLMHFNNLCGWQKTFSVAASVIELKSGIKGTSFKRARYELQEKGYIHVTSRSGNQAAVYQMISQMNIAAQHDKQICTEQTHLPTAPKQNNQQITAVATQSAQTSSITTSITDHSGTILTEVPIDVQPTENNTVHNPADKSVHKMNHNADPLIKQNIKQTKKIHQSTTTTSDAIQFYQENFGVASSYVSTDICHWINDLSEPLVLEAMKRALEQNKTTWSYVKGVLKAWARKGITTIEQAEADEAAFRNRQNQQKNQSAQASGEVVPDWFKERKRKQAEEKRPLTPEISSEEQAEVERLLLNYRNRDVGRKGVLACHL
ncbi:DnaD domain-containing protein [Virgibacillus litoralis]|uniref:DnaD/phage-associated family protein n=1 Tax=Virgibacillus litoralis TaxID=578221 RepID=A0ABS4HEV0_9BACI|nr:DnaD domain protein [Virgibacillus litoralis]MBP1949358.1 DnaD/phage-associated family protein [Virgibacillus litoralis]